ncbi:MAG: multiheme c-type cytochrome [Fibrobacterota bacterium]
MKRFLLAVFLFSVAAAQTPFDYALSVMDLAGKKTVLSAYRDKPLIVLYFSLDCGKCKQAVTEAQVFHKNNPTIPLIGVLTGSNKEADFRGRKPGSFGFPAYYDKYRSFRDQYRLEQVPTTFFIARSGKILQQKEKYFEGNYGDVLSVYGAVLAGRDTTFVRGMQDRYYSAEVCQACHTKIYEHWKGTAHASAYDPIAKKFFSRGYRDGFAAEVDPACLKCHTLGFGETGGYDETRHPKHLLGVQCESCHTAAGPHGGEKGTDYESRCLRCHDSKQDPLFRYPEKLKKIKHPQG